MTWAEFCGARQLLAEEMVGRVVREAQRVEDETDAHARKMLGG